MNINDSFRFLNTGLPEDIERCKQHGDLSKAVALIDKRLADERTAEGLRACLTAEREMMLRTPRQFPYSREEAIAVLRGLVPDFSDEEFEAYVDNGYIRWVYINGERRFIRRFKETIIKTDPSFAARAGVQSDTAAARGGENNPLDRCIRIMKENGSMAVRVRVRETITVSDDAFVKGAEALVHLPVPAECDTQSDIRIESIEPAGGIVDAADAEQRTVYWRETMQENHPFSVEFSYVHKELYHDESFRGELDPHAGDFLGEEQPHIVFTPYIRELARKITGDAETAYEKARRIYDYITKTMHYTYMPGYFILENISESCAKNNTGDCGVFALLFITLCRCSGVPAVWESGNEAQPESVGCHDWARFYAEPYGWLRADVSFGVSSTRVGNEERRRFYFGNLEPYRLVSNRVFQGDLPGDKQGWRADPYDNQSGEIELNGKGLIAGEFITEKKLLLHEEL